MWHYQFWFPKKVRNTWHGVSPFCWPHFFWPEWPHFIWPDFEKSSQPCVFVLVMGGNTFYTTEASTYFIQLLFIVHFFYPFQTIHRSTKQTHFPVIIFRCAARKKQTTTLAWPHTHAMIKVFDLSSFHKFMGKPLTLRFATLCLHLTGVWPILNAAVNCSNEGYSYTLNWFDGLVCNK